VSILSNRKEIYFVILALLVSGQVWAQFDDGSLPEKTGQDEVEQLYDRFDRKESRRKKQQRQRRKRQRKKEADVSSLTELAKLSPLKDIAVIQRRFLPKTERFEFSANGMTSVNNPFFNNLGFGLRGSYYFKEKYGVEVSYLLMSNTERSVTENLREKRNVKTESLVSPDSYFGASFKWTPMFGKFAFLNDRIIPFDLYFNGGLGVTKTGGGDNSPTLSLGTGQVFAISKAVAFRWDFTWNFYQASSVVDGQSTTVNQDDLLVSVGMSFFFPEASYR